MPEPDELVELRRLLKTAEARLLHYEETIGAPQNACFSGRADDPEAEREWLRGHWKNALEQWGRAKERALKAEAERARYREALEQVVAVGELADADEAVRVARAALEAPDA